MEILKVEDLNFRYPGAGTNAMESVSFSVERGEMIAVCGGTGSGKTTLLRLFKPELSPRGERSGRIFAAGVALGLPDEMRESPLPAGRIGFVAQRPEQQIVTDKVWHELAFGLENLGVAPDVIARRIAETAGYFGMEDWYERDTASLSGGQKQLLNLAAVTVMQPDILILDEPTSQLDPIAASEFISAVVKLNRECGVTVLISEHRLEEVIPVCNRVLALEEGKLRFLLPPRKAMEALAHLPALLRGMPAAARIFLSLQTGKAGECPLTVREGKDFIEETFQNRIRALPEPENNAPQRADVPCALELKHAYFRYGRELPDVLCGLDLQVRKGEIFCVLGGNGSGKTTMLNVAAGLLPLYSGNVKIFGKRLKEYKGRSLYRNCLAYLPQDVQTLFSRNTVKEELEDSGTDASALPFDLRRLYDVHPYDLSGGEQQLLGLAKVLASKPQLLLLDEPTKGLDAGAKEELTAILRDLRAQGVTILVVTHDVEFAARTADRCALFFRGTSVSEGSPAAFFGENRFYTTAVSRMTRGYYDRVVTVEDAVALCLANGRKEFLPCL